MFPYKLSVCGFESHCSHLESFTYPRVSRKGSEGGGTVFDIFDFWSCWALFCIELIDLIPMSFFKEMVIVLLKMHAAGEIFVKICLKARHIRHPYTKLCITHIVFVSECVQGIIQKKLASGCWTLPLVILDKKVPFFPKIVLF